MQLPKPCHSWLTLIRLVSSRIALILRLYFLVFGTIDRPSALKSKKKHSVGNFGSVQSTEPSDSTRGKKDNSIKWDQNPHYQLWQVTDYLHQPTSPYTHGTQNISLLVRGLLQSVRRTEHLLYHGLLHSPKIRCTYQFSWSILLLQDQWI